MLGFLAGTLETGYRDLDGSRLAANGFEFWSPVWNQPLDPKTLNPKTLNSKTPSPLNPEPQTPKPITCASYPLYT